MRMHKDAEKNLKDDLYQIQAPFQFEEQGADKKAMSSCMQEEDSIEKIKELQAYIDKVKKIVKPGCSQEVLNVALGSISSLVSILSHLSSASKFHASL